MGDCNRVSKGYYVDLLSQKGLQVSNPPASWYLKSPKPPLTLSHPWTSWSLEAAPKRHALPLN